MSTLRWKWSFADRHRTTAPDTTIRRLGRFLREDPLGFIAGVNFFRYSANNPQNAIDPSGLLHVFIWNFNGSAGEGTNWGHAAILLDDGTYISWWPGAADDANNPNVVMEEGGKHFARNARSADFMQDVMGEGHGPDEDIYLNSLDKNAIRQWWGRFQKNKLWDSYNRNCSNAAMDALKSGGSERAEKAPRSRLLPTSPKDVLDYSQKLQSHNRINFDFPLINPVVFP